MPKDHKPRAKGGEKKLTRAKAEKMLAAGADPTDARFVSHVNFHVRSKAWKKQGMPLPEDATERAKLLASLHVKEKVQESPQSSVDPVVEAP